MGEHGLIPDHDLHGSRIDNVSSLATPEAEGLLCEMDGVVYRSTGTSAPTDWEPIAAKCNFSATTNPGVGDDDVDGYEVGSVWINTSTDAVYMCTDPSTGAANWEELNAGSGGFAGSGATTYRTVSETHVGNIGWTDVDLNLELEDTDSYHDLVTNRERITIPVGKAGFYCLTYTLVYKLDTGGISLGFAFYKNGAILQSNLFQEVQALDLEQTVSSTIWAELAENDYITTRITGESGGSGVTISVEGSMSVFMTGT